jgi:hypothetical protein
VTRVLVTGSQTFTDESRILEVLSEYAVPGAVLVSGHCPRGADYFAERIWEEVFHLEVEKHPARWNEHGKSAGFVRNQEMVDAGADVCLAFIDYCRRRTCTKPKPHYSHGTAHCARRAEIAGIPVRRFRRST